MRFSFLAMIAGVCLAVPMAARADDFTITGTNTITFSLSASPTPVSFAKGEGFILDDVQVILNGTPMNEDLLFFEDGIIIGQDASILQDGIFPDYEATDELANDFSVIPDARSFNGFASAPLYTPNGESAPIFLAGTYSLEDQISNGDTTLTVTAGAASPTAPEPSSIVLLGTGLLGIAGALKRRYA